MFEKSFPQSARPTLRYILLLRITGNTAASFHICSNLVTCVIAFAVCYYVLLCVVVSYVVLLCYVCCVYDTYRPVHAVFCLITALIVISFSENVNAFRPTFHDIIRHLSENINKKSCYSPPITVETTTFH